MHHISILLLAISLLTSCTKTNDPEIALKEYVDLRFSNENISRNDVLKRTSGTLQQQISNMSDDEFTKFQTKNLKKRAFRILSTKCAKDECFVTYSIKYDTFDNSDGKVFTSEIKKIAQLQKENNEWKIVDVNNIKTFHDSKKALEIK